MKKEIILFFVFITFLSCSKDEENNSDLLRGKWYYKEVEINGIITPYSDHEDCGKDFLNFYSSNEVKSVDVFDCIPETDWDGFYTRSENTLTISVSSASIEFEILQLTNHLLELSYETDSNNDGIIEIQIERLER